MIKEEDYILEYFDKNTYKLYEADANGDLYFIQDIRKSDIEKVCFRNISEYKFCRVNFDDFEDEMYQEFERWYCECSCELCQCENFAEFYEWYRKIVLKCYITGLVKQEVENESI